MSLPPREEHEPELPSLLETRSPFAHPAWSVGVVLILGSVSLFLGIAGHPIWLLLGSPFILTLLVWVGVKVTVWRRGAPPDVDPGPTDGV